LRSKGVPVTRRPLQEDVRGGEVVTNADLRGLLLDLLAEAEMSAEVDRLRDENERLLAGENPQLPPEVIPPPVVIEPSAEDLRRQERWNSQEAAEAEALTYLRAFMRRIGRQTAQRIGLDEAWDWMMEDEEKDTASGTVVGVLSTSEIASTSDDALSAYAETLRAEIMTAARRLDLDGLKRLGMDKLADLVRKEDEEQALTGAQGGK